MLTHQINEPYSRYFQKSMVFLFPLAGIPLHDEIKPLKSYIHLPGLVDLDTPEIILEFEKHTEVIQFLDPIIARNPRLKKISGLSERLFVLVDLSQYKEQYLFFLNGSYSRFDQKVKQQILNFHTKNKANLAYIHSFLYPERYFSQYAKLFDISENTLQEVGELIDKPNLLKETLNYKGMSVSMLQSRPTIHYLPNVNRELNNAMNWPISR